MICNDKPPEPKKLTTREATRFKAKKKQKKPPRKSSFRTPSKNGLAALGGGAFIDHFLSYIYSGLSTLSGYALIIFAVIIFLVLWLIYLSINK